MGKVGEFQDGLLVQIAVVLVAAPVVALGITGMLDTFSSPDEQARQRPPADSQPSTAAQEIRQRPPFDPLSTPPLRGREVPSVDVSGPGRTSEGFRNWALQVHQTTKVDVQALQAYANAQARAALLWPGCNLNWSTLAGVGWVETRHGTYDGNLFGGSSLDDNGVATPPIVGPALDGVGFAYVGDYDGGAYDNDPVHDHAVGPMQFIPESWDRLSVDADGDGYANPHQIDDAALTAASLLCADSNDMGTREGWEQALFSYNQSDEYLAEVREAANKYAWLS